MPLFLGIDGGQSSTTALIGDENGTVLGEGIAGPCNHVGAAERRAKFFAAVGDSVRKAAEQAGVEPRFAGVCAGFSGGAKDKQALLRELVQAEHYSVVDDTHIALAGATGGEPGVIVIAGTGSIAYGRNAAGKTARAGGWGYIFGDEGSAFDIARQALRAILRFDEGWGQPTSLREMLLDASGASDTNDLLHLCYTSEFPRERIAKFAALVDAASGSGDAVATAILDGAAQSLAILGMTVRRTLFADEEPASVYSVGGVFESGPVQARFRLLLESDSLTSVRPPRYSPARGALLEAIRLRERRIP